MPQFLRSRSLLIAATIMLPLLSVLAEPRKPMMGMSINWTFPYFSGAANFKKIFDWRISISDFDQVAQISQENYIKYNHKKTNDLIKYTSNNYGYLLVILFSKKIFPFLGDIEGVIYFRY